MTDETCLSLLESAQADPASSAWSEFDHLYSPLILRWALARGLQEADAADLRQEVMEVVFRELPKFGHNGRPGAFRCWLKNITANRLRDRWRRSGRQEVAGGGSDYRALSEQLEDPDSRLSIEWDAEHDRHVCAHLLQLIRNEFQPRSIEVFSQVVLESRDPADVAREFNMSLNAIRITRHRVLRRLRQLGTSLIEFEGN